MNTTKHDPARVWAYCEFYISSVDTARLLFADDGRPLGERYAAERVRTGVPFDMRRCPYPGSRQGKQMNVSALRGVQADWGEVLDDMACFSLAFMRRYRLERLDWGWLWVMGRTVTSLPVLLARTSGEGSGTIVPRRIASLFKPALGIAMTPERVMLAGGDPTDEPTAAQFFAETEERGVFLTPDAACSGPVRHVREFLETAMDGSARTPASWGVNDVTVETLLEYGWLNAELELAKYRFMLALAGAPQEQHEAMGVGRSGEFEGCSIEILSAALDAEMARLGFSARAASLGARPFVLANWMGLFNELFEPVAGMLGADSTHSEPLSARDARLMVRHLSMSWRSGLDEGIRLATVPVVSASN